MLILFFLFDEKFTFENIFFKLSFDAQPACVS